MHKAGYLSFPENSPDLPRVLPAGGSSNQIVKSDEKL